MSTLSLQIQAETANGGGQIDTHSVSINENIGDETPVGTLIGCDIPGLIFEIFNEDGEPDGRYGIVAIDNGDNTFTYRLVVANGASDAFDAEHPIYGNSHGLQIKVYQSDGQGGRDLIAEDEFEIILNDINDVPDAPSLINGGAISDGDNIESNDWVGSLASFDQDGDAIEYLFKYTVNGSAVYSTTSQDGRFRLDGDGNITVADETQIRGQGDQLLSYEIVARDIQGGEHASIIDLEIADVNNRPDAPQFQGGEVNENIGTGDDVGVLTATDPDQDIPTFVFQATGTNISGDGLFRIEADGRVVVVNADNIQVPDGVPYNERSYDVIARDAQLEGPSTEITIRINNLPDGTNRLPSAPRWDDGDTGVIQETVGDGYVVGDLLSEDPDGGQVTFKFRYFDEASQQFVLRDVSQDNRFKIVDGQVVVNDWGAIQVDDEDGRFTYEVVAIDDEGGQTTAPVTVTVQDVPNVVEFETASISQAEGDGGVITYTYTVKRTNNFGDMKVAWALSGDVDRADFPGFILPSGEVEFAAGSYTATITFTVSSDTTFEADEDFTITLLEVTEGQGTIGAGNTATGTIQNDDEVPTLPVVQFGEFAEPEFEEGNSGTRTFTFQVVRDSIDGIPVVHWSVAGNQVNAADFVGGIIPSGEVRFAADSLEAFITVEIAGDAIFEPNEQFFVVLTSAEGAVIGNRSVVGAVIANDDAEPTVPVVQFQSASVELDEGGEGSTVEYVFVLTRNALGPSKVKWDVRGLTADAADFGGALPSGEVEFDESSYTAEIRFTIEGDENLEANETFQVWLTQFDDSAVIGNEAIAFGMIRNDDPVVEFDEAYRTVDRVEGDAGTVTYTFRLTRDMIGAESRVQWTVVGTGANAADFGGAFPSGIAVFDADDTFYDITFTISSDKLDESDFESFNVVLEAIENATIGNSGTAAGNILDDDETPAIPGWEAGNLGQVYDTVEGGAAVGDLMSTDGDGDTVTFLFKFIDNGQTVYSDVSRDGKFKIVGGQVVTNGDIQITDGSDEQEFTYTIAAQDGNGNESEGQITVTVVDRNRSPYIISVVPDGNGEPGNGENAGFIVVSELDPLGIIAKVTADDLDVNQTVTYSLESHDELFSIDGDGFIRVINRALLSVTQHTTYQLSVKVADGAGGFVLQTVNIKVLNETDPSNLDPTIARVDPVEGNSETGSDGAIEVDEGGPNGGIAMVVASDPEGADLYYGLENDYDGLFDIDEATGQITINREHLPDSDLNQEFTLVVAVSDGTTGSARRTVTIRVLSANQNPEITSIFADEHGQDGTHDGNYAVLVSELAGTGTIAQVTASDPNGDTLQYSLADTFGGLFDIDQNGRIFVANGTRLGVDDDTAYELTVEVTDGRNGSATRTVFVKVLNDNVPGNNEPDITDVVASGVGQAGGVGVIRVASTAQVGEIGTTVAEDPDTIDVLTYALVDDRGGRFGIDENTGKIVFLEPFSPSDVGTIYSLRVQVSDGNGGTDFHDVTIEIVENAAPDLDIEAGREETVVAPDQPAFAFNGVILQDDEGDQLTLTISFDAERGTLGYENVTGVTVLEDGDLSDGTNTYTFVGTAGLLQDFLDDLSFTSDAPGGTLFDLTLRDGWHQDVLYEDAILVTEEATAGNDAPGFLVEGDDEFLAAPNEDRNAFAGIALSDDENDVLTLTIRYQSNNTTLTPEIITGVMVDSDTTDLDGVRTITLSGKFRALNNYLDALKFKAVAPGVTTFDFTLKDAGHDAAIHNGAITVTVEENPGVNDAPVVTIADSTVGVEVNTAAAIFAEALSGVELYDDENADLTLTLSFENANRILTLGALVGVTIESNEVDDLSGLRTIVLKGKYGALNALLANSTFTAEAAGDTTFSFTLSDGVNPVTPVETVVVSATGEPPPTDPTDIRLSQNSVREFPTTTANFIGNLSTDVAGDYVYKIVLANGTLVDSDGTFKIDGLRLVADTRYGLDFELKRSYGLKIRVMKVGETDPDDWYLEETLPITIRDWQGENINIGTAGNDILLGGTGGDTLVGGEGNDTLGGGIGRDRLTGDAGNDVFRFDRAATAVAHRDVIVDFESGVDKIQLSHAMFRLGSTGGLNAARYVEGPEATLAGHRLIYNKDAAGGAKLYYDPDGNGAATKIEIATFVNNPARILLTDFELIA